MRFEATDNVSNIGGDVAARGRLAIGAPYFNRPWILALIAGMAMACSAQTSPPSVASAQGAVQAQATTPARVSAYQELVPTPRSQIDEDEVFDAPMGPLVFHIKNRNLAFPWPRGEHSLQKAPCDTPSFTASERNRAWCKSLVTPKREVFLVFDMPAGLISPDQRKFRSGVTLGYQEGWIFDENSPEAYAAEIHPWAGGSARAPQWDTKIYAAVRTSTKPWIHPVTGKLYPPVYSYMFVSKNGQSPHIVSCAGRPGDPGFLKTTECDAVTPLFVNDFPKDAKGKFPFAVAYGFPGALLDQAPKIEAAIVADVLAIPRSPTSRGDAHH